MEWGGLGMTILLDTPFEVGDEVRHKTDKEAEETFIVLAYYLLALNKEGEVTLYNVDCSNGDGIMKSFRPWELEVVEKVKK